MGMGQGSFYSFVSSISSSTLFKSSSKELTLSPHTSATSAWSSVTEMGSWTEIYNSTLLDIPCIRRFLSPSCFLQECDTYYTPLTFPSLTCPLPLSHSLLHQLYPQSPHSYLHTHRLAQHRNFYSPSFLLPSHLLPPSLTLSSSSLPHSHIYTNHLIPGTSLRVILPSRFLFPSLPLSHSLILTPPVPSETDVLKVEHSTSFVRQISSSRVCLCLSQSWRAFSQHPLLPRACDPKWTTGPPQHYTSWEGHKTQTTEEWKHLHTHDGTTNKWYNYRINMEE